jgi:hypothetical protein
MGSTLTWPFVSLNEMPCSRQKRSREP